MERDSDTSAEVVTLQLEPGEVLALYGFLALGGGRRARAHAVTELEFALRTARALLSALPDKATDFFANTLARRVDPRLRHLIEPALAALGRDDCSRVSAFRFASTVKPLASRGCMLLAPRWPDVNAARISGTPQSNTDGNRAVGDEEPVIVVATG